MVRPPTKIHLSLIFRFSSNRFSNVPAGLQASEPIKPSQSSAQPITAYRLPN